MRYHPAETQRGNCRHPMGGMLGALRLGRVLTETYWGYPASNWR